MSDPGFDRAFGEDCVPVPRKKKFDIISPKPQTEVKAQITSERPTATYSHFCNKITYPCSRDPRSCPFCAKKIDPRWKAYLAGISIVTGKAVLIEITQGAAFECQPIRDPSVCLRSKIITLYRRGKAPNSPVFCRLEDATGHLARFTLPQPFDVRRAILDMWGNPFTVYNPATGKVEDEPPEGESITQ